ncbi:hypothetical protein JMJ35_007316 [Cladonia borealis]|uniref:Uncharacterized protein n=1 Tax=Cladonia borealis TaxID=184061 RepID=A0AA39UZN1_9LECA|nr:hypothetical protein JMJ35_007316 [Cladonia borealis]
MSTTLGVGVPVPKMLPITGTWTLPFAAYLVYLSNRVFYRRIQREKYVGDRYDESATSNDNPDPLLLDSRAHANFLESVPLAFTLTAIAELNGANRKILNYSMAVLFVLRLIHVELGLKGKDTVGWGRPTGFFGTQGFLAGMAAYSTYLVKGYWGY